MTGSPSSSIAGAGLSAPSPSPKRRTVYPQWPETNEESEYWEVPPEHFLAQQGKAASRQYPGSGEDYAYLADQEAQPGPSSSPRSLPVSSTEHLQNSPQTTPTPSPQPLEYLAHILAGDGQHAALPAGLPDTSTLAGADFDVDVRSGFLPPEPPLERLPNELEESQWEHMLTAARTVGLKINGGGIAVDDAERRRCRLWRRQIRNMPVVHPSRKLQTDLRYARRGHVVLTFLAHFYIHSLPQPQPAAVVDATVKSGWFSSFWSGRNKGKASQPAPLTSEERQDIEDAQAELRGDYAARLPASISVPLLLLSSQLDLPPVLTYADTVLWNWRFKDSRVGLELSNLEIVETFSGTESEKHFFLTSLLIELRGVAALDIMRVCLDECFLGDALAKRRVASYLFRLVDVIQDLEKILRDVRTDCDPATFYWGIRPWFRGGDASPHERKGWFYPTSLADENNPHLQPRLFTGPSAGQSSLIHAIDVFFDVDHALVKERRGRPVLRPAVRSEGGGGGNQDSPRITADATTLPEDATFMQRMQLYMPGQHRRFLTHLQSLTAEANEDVSQSVAAANVSRDFPEAAAASVEVKEGPASITSPLRQLALSVPSGSNSDPGSAASYHHPLPKAYDAALTALRSLRDEHMRVATLYIVTQSRSKPPKQYADLNADFVGHSKTLVDDEKEREDSKKKRKRGQQHGGDDDHHDDDDDDEQAEKKAKLQRQTKSAGQAEAEAQQEDDGEDSGAKGTGGTNLVQFLKACRTNTVDTLLSSGAPGP